MKIAVIPARGGSKRIPKKNIKNFCGKPMIAWSIEKAIDSGLFDYVLVSTDDSSIAKVAKECGAEVPFIRPKSLSDDHTGTTPVTRHATQWVTENIGPVNYVCTIYATAPFIEVKDLVTGFRSLSESSHQLAISVTSYNFPIQRALKLNKDNSVTMFQPEHYHTRSQDLEASFHDAGQFYWAKMEAINAESIAFSENSLAVIIPRHRALDIDTEEDWVRAELMFKSYIKPFAG